MATPDILDWITEPISPSKLNDTTHGQGTTSQRNTIASSGTWPAFRPFFDTDEGKWYYNSDGGAPSSVTWSLITGGGGMFQKTTIPALSEVDALDIWDERLYRGNIYRLNDNLTSPNGLHLPIIKWEPLTAIDSPTDKLPVGDILSDDFGSYADDPAFNGVWVSSDEGQMNPEADVNWIDCRLDVGVSNVVKVVADLGGFLNQSWVARINLNIDVVTQNTGNDITWFAGMRDLNVQADTAAQSFGLKGRLGDTETDLYNVAESGRIDLSIGTSFSHDLQVEDLFIEITKTAGTSLKVELFSNSAFTISIETITDSSINNITNLRYLIITADEGSTSTHNHDLQVRKWAIQNGVTTWV